MDPLLNFKFSDSANVESLATQASFHFSQPSSGSFVDFTAEHGTEIRKDKMVNDIGTVLAVSHYQSMVGQTVMVPAPLSYSFDGAMSAASISLRETPSFAKLRGIVIAEALRSRVISGDASTLQELAPLATSYNIPVADLVGMIERVTAKMATLIGDKQSASLLSAITDTNILDSYEALFRLPRVAWADCYKAHTILGQVYSSLIQGTDLFIIDATINTMVQEIEAFSHVQKLLTVQQYNAFPPIPMSTAALFSLVGETGPDADVPIPYIERMREGDAEGTVGQFKFWRLEAPDYYGKICINDVIKTLSLIDTMLFGVTSGSTSLESYMTFAMNSGVHAAVPAPPVAGSSLLDTPAIQAILSTTVFTNAMTRTGSPQSSAIVTQLANYKVTENTAAIKPALLLKIASLIALADAMPQVRSLFISVLDKANDFSFLCSDSSQAQQIGGDHFGIIQLDSLGADGSTLGDDRDGIALKERASTKRTKRGKQERDSGDTSPNSYSPSGNLLNRLVFGRFYELYNKALLPLAMSASDPSTVRAIFEPSHLLARPASFRLTFEMGHALTLEPWYKSSPEGEGISTISLPLPYIYDGKRVFGSGSLGVNYGDAHATVLAPNIIPNGVRHFTVPFFTVDPSVSLVGPFDLTGIISIMPVSTLKRFTQARSSSYLAGAAATLIARWHQGNVSTGFHRLQTAMFAKSARLLQMAGPDDLFQAWPGLYRSLSIPSTEVLSGIDKTQLAVESFSLQLDPSPVVMIPFVSALRVERAELMGPNYSFVGPLFAIHTFAHNSLSVLDASIIMTPPKSLAVSSGSSELIVNRAQISSVAKKREATDNENATMATSVTNSGVVTEDGASSTNVGDAGSETADPSASDPAGGQ